MLRKPLVIFLLACFVNEASIAKTVFCVGHNEEGKAITVIEESSGAEPLDEPQLFINHIKQVFLMVRISHGHLIVLTCDIDKCANTDLLNGLAIDSYGETFLLEQMQGEEPLVADDTYTLTCPEPLLQGKKPLDSYALLRPLGRYGNRIALALQNRYVFTTAAPWMPIAFNITTG